MFLKAGAVALALLLASRVLGLVRESAQAAAFGATGLADVAVLMLTLPDWVAGMVASGALAYVLVPAWAAQEPGQVRATQRRVAIGLLGAAIVLAIGIFLARPWLVDWLAPGLPADLAEPAASGLAWSAVSLPAALLAALWVTRLQHERDVTGMYAGNLVVNAVVIAAIALSIHQPREAAVRWLGLGLVAAMALRLGWLAWRQAPHGRDDSAVVPPALPPRQVWLWAGLSAALPLALPFVARSAASQAGPGSLATFNYAWKLVELPLVLAIQLVAALALPAIARAFAPGVRPGPEAKGPVSNAFALGWTLACAAAAALLVGAPALSQLLFGWGRMDEQALGSVARWGAAAAWGLLPQSLIAVALAVLAAQLRLRFAALAHAGALAVLVGAAAAGASDGLALMWLLNALYCGVGVLCLGALGRQTLLSLPWATLGLSLAALVGVAGVAAVAHTPLQTAGMPLGLLLAAAASVLLMGVTWLASPSLRQALRR